jgi:CBS domain containing-hemolysin-like protein
MAQAGRLLQQGDVVEFEDLRFEVERLERRRIRRIRLRRINKTSSQDESLTESATVNQ